MKYPVYKPEITSLEKQYVNECLDSSWISSRGEYIEKFENTIAEFTGVKYAVAVSNGTVALHLALLAYGIGKYDEVILPDLTYVATANSVLYVNANPVIVDVDSNTWNITLKNIKQKTTSKTRAIIVADLYGTPAEMDEIFEFATKNNIIIIEDAAEALGAKYKSKMAGNLGNIGTFSFFGNKTITTGEGGMVLTNDSSIYRLLLQLRNQGNSIEIQYFHDILGYNYRMTNIQAAIGYAQSSRLREIIKRKREIFDSYFKHLNGKVDFQVIPDYIHSSYWMISFLLKNNIERNALMYFLKELGIETRPFFNPIHRMPYFENQNNPISQNLSERGINVPSFHTLNDTDIEYICDSIIQFLNFRK